MIYDEMGTNKSIDTVSLWEESLLLIVSINDLR